MNLELWKKAFVEIPCSRHVFRDFVFFFSSFLFFSNQLFFSFSFFLSFLFSFVRSFVGSFVRSILFCKSTVRIFRLNDFTTISSWKRKEEKKKEKKLKKKDRAESIVNDNCYVHNPETRISNGSHLYALYLLFFFST